MEATYYCNFTNPNDFPGTTDSQRIQAAVNEAACIGCNKVVIPSLNMRTGAYLWVIDETIELPSHMYIEINNAHLRMADGVYCQMFRNANAFTEVGKTADGLQEDIIIQGVGRAILDGGKHNGLREDTHSKNGLPHIVHNLTVYLHNVRNFKIDGLTIRDQRWWAIAFAWAWEGIVSNLRFEITDKSYRSSSPKSKEHPWRNQDGVDLRVGCHDIQIMNLTGETCDDIVALTALAVPGSNRFEDQHRCEHLSPDIYNVSIRNITGFTNHCAMIRLLCHFRNQLYNISIDNIIDASPRENSIVVNEGQRTAVCVKVGEYGYHKNDLANLCQLGEMRNISISHVFSSAFAAVDLNAAVKNLTVRDIFVGEKGRHAISVSRISGGKHQSLKDPENITTLENISVDGVYYTSHREDGVPFFFDNMKAKNFAIKNVTYPGGTLVEQPRIQEDSEEVIFENMIIEE